MKVYKVRFVLSFYLQWRLKNADLTLEIFPSLFVVTYVKVMETEIRVVAVVNLQTSIRPLMTPEMD